MERIDKIIGMQTEYSRKDVKKLVLQKRVKLNGEIVLKSEQKINPNIDNIYIDDKPINIKEKVYNMPQKWMALLWVYLM